MVKCLLLANFGQLFIKSRKVCKYDCMLRANLLVASRLAGASTINFFYGHVNAFRGRMRDGNG